MKHKLIITKINRIITVPEINIRNEIKYLGSEMNNYHILCVNNSSPCMKCWSLDNTVLDNAV